MCCDSRFSQIMALKLKGTFHFLKIFLVLLRWKYVITGPTAWELLFHLNISNNIPEPYIDYHTEPNLQKKMWIKERRFLDAQNKNWLPGYTCNNIPGIALTQHFKSRNWCWNINQNFHCKIHILLHYVSIQVIDIN